jgi:hypothetical protein
MACSKRKRQSRVTPPFAIPGVQTLESPTRQISALPAELRLARADLLALVDRARENRLRLAAVGTDPGINAD